MFVSSLEFSLRYFATDGSMGTVMGLELPSSLSRFLTAQRGGRGVMIASVPSLKRSLDKRTSAAVKKR